MRAKATSKPGSTAKRHRTTREAGITKPAICRLARRAGCKRLASQCYEVARAQLLKFLQQTVGDAILYTLHAKRATVTVQDTVHALKLRGQTVYGF